MNSCEFCEISRNTFFIEHLRVTASVNCFFREFHFPERVNLTLVGRVEEEEFKNLHPSLNSRESLQKLLSPNPSSFFHY